MEIVLFIHDNFLICLNIKNSLMGCKCWEVTHVSDSKQVKFSSDLSVLCNRRIYVSLHSMKYGGPLGHAATQKELNYHTGAPTFLISTIINCFYLDIF